MNKVGEVEVSVPRAVLLDHLKKNRENHTKIVAEAREGYIKKAEEELRKRLKDLRSGKLVSLTFSLQPPQDYTTEYDSLIGMMSLSTDETVTVTTSEYRCMAEDNWGWRQHFLLANAGYSKTAASLSMPDF